MNTIIRLFPLAFFLFDTVSCSAQTSKAKLTEAEFKKFDKNESGWLSGNEITACNCKNYDGDGDGEVTKEEFFTGKGVSMQVEKKAVVNVEKPKQKTAEANNGTAGGNIKGNWWYSSLIYANGEVYKLRNRQSVLELKPNGDFYMNTWTGGINNMSNDGTYTVSGKRLTLTKKDGKKEVFSFSLSADGSVLTLKGGDGSGSTLERSK